MARYRMSIADKHVPAHALKEREHELLSAVREAEVSAAELFGDADVLAKEDAAELATVEEEVRASLGGGLRPALREVGNTLMGIGIVAVLLMIVRHGWSLDIDIALVLVAGSVLVVFMGWVVSRAVFAAGRSASAVGVLMASGAAALAGLASAASLDSDHIVASDVPTPLLALAMLAPGVAALVAASRMTQQASQEGWDDAEWLRRFRGGLRAHLMPATTARGHVAEIEQALVTGKTSAFAEFGHPLTLAREVAAADSAARKRRWWLSTVAGTGAPLAIGSLIILNQSWGVLTIPVAVAFLLAGVIAPVLGWDDRPWVKGP
ncbi:hypothetical protein [Nocardioides aequoreus]|uniref:hypothetical protein n=1 Tax=Nocardioides aequoreus TaxID=397278 RepID=UPI001B80AADE|nr:hypothetical protein [Nocardioides aequoreus]